MKLLGLAGESGSGKDFTYQWIKDHRVGPTHRLAFAEGVREEVMDLLGVSSEALVKPYTLEIRALLQWWGTEYRRAQDVEYWIKSGMERLETIEFGYSDLASNPEWVKLKAEDLLVVVTDVRFANEVNAIELRDGLSRLVLATRSVRKGRLGELPPSHASEEMDFETGGIIHNDVNGSTPIFDEVLADWMGIDSGWVVDASTGQIVAYEPE